MGCPRGPGTPTEVDPFGGAYLAYHEVDEHWYPVENNVKLATMPPALIFADDFECGNTSTWSITFP